VTESVGNQAYNYALSVTHNEEKKTQYIMAGFKGGGDKLGSCPEASTTKGPPQKQYKKLLPKET